MTNKVSAVGLVILICCTFCSDLSWYYDNDINSIPSTANSKIGCMTSSNILYFFGGYPPQHTVYSYNFSSNTWTEFGKILPVGIDGPPETNCVAVDNMGPSQTDTLIYMMSFVTTTTKLYMYVFNTSSNQFIYKINAQDIETMLVNVTRACITSNYDNKLIYVMGGVIATLNYSNLLQIYDVNDNSWSLGAKIPTSINNEGMEEFGFYQSQCEYYKNTFINKSFIYLLGGYGYSPINDESSSLSDIYQYDIELNEWSHLSLALSDHPRSRMSVVAPNKYIYIVQQDDVTRFDPINMLYHFDRNLPEYRDSGNLFSYNNKLYLFGGHAHINVLYANFSNDSLMNGITFLPTMYPSYNPTLSPTDNPTNPTKNPSIYPTFNPTQNPSSNPSLYPSFSPTARPSETPSNTPSNTPSTAPSLSPIIIWINSTNDNMSPSDINGKDEHSASLLTLFSWIGVFMTILFIIATIFGYIYSKYFVAKLHHKYQWIAISMFGFFTIDFITDIFFILFVYDDYVYHDNLIYLCIFLVSFLVILTQVISNLIHLHRDMKIWTFANNEYGSEIANYLNKYAVLMYTLCVFSGNSYATIKLCCSYFLNINFFKLKLKINQQMRSQNKNILLNLFWNIPHLAMQIIYSLYNKELTDITLLAIIFNSFAMIVTLFSYATRKHLLKHWDSNFDILSESDDSNQVKMLQNDAI